jgi:hypothetical protein
MANPVSWLLVEKGWEVVGLDGEQVGTVDEVIGDSGSDIFNGLAVSTSLLGRPRYVPAERVREIVEGRVVLDLDEAAFERLAEHGETPPGERDRSESTDA